MVSEDRWRALELQSKAFSAMVKNIHPDDKNVQYVQTVDDTLNWVLWPSNYLSPFEKLIERNSNFLKVSG